MKPRELQNLGIPKGKTMTLTVRLIAEAMRAGLSKSELRPTLVRIIASPSHHLDDPDFGSLARALLPENQPRDVFVERDTPAPWKQWGKDLEKQSVEQMVNACRLPVAVAGALMPDAHLGYGLPIGGVLATDNAIIPYAVGVDIACRMKLTVLDLPAPTVTFAPDRRLNAIATETRVRTGSHFTHRPAHLVPRAAPPVSEITKNCKDKAWAQLGTSGSGNHVVEFGIFTI